MSMKTHVEFRSDQFPADPDEDEVVNPGLYGRRIAEFLAEGLRSQGFEVAKPLPEDWGWVVEMENKEFPLWIGCGHQGEYPDDFLCFIEPHKPEIWRLLKRVNTTEHVQSLHEAIDNILRAHPGIRDISMVDIRRIQ